MVLNVGVLTYINTYLDFYISFLMFTTTTLRLILTLLLSSSSSSMLSLTTAAAAFASSSSSPIPPPPPISMPVWSLTCPASTSSSSKATTTSMNILTFCTPVSISPKLWALALYYDTLTMESFMEHGTGILQLLTRQHNHPSLVPILGKQSGKAIDKKQACQDTGVSWKEAPMIASSRPIQVLPHCATYLEMTIQNPQSRIDAGDHLVVICQVTQIGKWNADTNALEWTSVEDGPLEPLDAPQVLYTGWLRDQGIL